MMKAVVWKGVEKVEVCDVPKPKIEAPLDAIVRVATFSMCGSDVSLYRDAYGSCTSGDILGHECVGYIEEIGDDLRNCLIVGERVVVSATVACGDCTFCAREQFNMCQKTASRARQMHPNCAVAGIFGCCNMKGGYAGVQSQYVRVPYANINCLRTTPQYPNEKLIFLADVFPTAWHANEIGNISDGDTVAVWGLGPIGLMTMLLAKKRGASCVLGIDAVADRRERCKNLGFCAIDCSASNAVDEILKILPDGPNVCIDCVGIGQLNVSSLAPRTANVALTATSVICQAAEAVQNGGRVVVVGIYARSIDNFPLGTFMEKGLQLRGSHVPVQRYWQDLVPQLGEIDTTFFISHTFSMENAPEAYRLLNSKTENVFKVLVNVM